MTEQTGRRRGRLTTQPPGTLTVLLQARVRPEIRNDANRVADACGVSMGLLVEQLVQRLELDPATGRPAWWDDLAINAAQEEELPLADAS